MGDGGADDGGGEGTESECDRCCCGDPRGDSSRPLQVPPPCPEREVDPDHWPWRSAHPAFSKRGCCSWHGRPGPRYPHRPPIRTRSRRRTGSGGRGCCESPQGRVPPSQQRNGPRCQCESDLSHSLRTRTSLTLTRIPKCRNLLLHLRIGRTGGNIRFCH